MGMKLVNELTNITTNGYIGVGIKMNGTRLGLLWLITNLHAYRMLPNIIIAAKTIQKSSEIPKI